MNTQRPEWNDANNALVGKGLSVVTLGYLRRYLEFIENLLGQSGLANASISQEVMEFFDKVPLILKQSQNILEGGLSDGQRWTFIDAMGQAGSDYRWNYYSKGFSGKSSQIPVKELVVFIRLARKYIEHSLRANKRSDHLYHAYNILHLSEGIASITPLYEMLEGQVAILSSGLLSGEEFLYPSEKLEA